MRSKSVVVRMFVGVSLLVGAFGASRAAARDTAAGPAAVSHDARVAVERIVRDADHHGQPFAVVDKRAARIFVFNGDARLAGASPVLLGLARGDAPGATAGLRRLADLRPGDRTTPAGRFASEPGHNDRGEAIVWIDYEASLAIHRLRPAPARERRPERLASPRADDKRISLGCVVVPVAFFDDIVAPRLGRERGVVYILPESRPAEALFDRGDGFASR